MPDKNNTNQSASPFDIVTTSKSKKGNKGIIIGAIVTVFLLISVVAGVLLVQQNQNIQEQAAGGSPPPVSPTPSNSPPPVSPTPSNSPPPVSPTPSNSPPPGGGNSPPPDGGGNSPPPGGATPPAPVTVSPTGTLACSNTSPSGVVFKWNSVTGAANYYLRIDDTTSSSSFTACGSGTTPLAGDFCIPKITGTTYTQSLPAGHNYRWWVSGFTSAGVQGTIGTPVTFSVPAICTSSTTLNSCNGTCTTDTDCQTGLICYSGFCRDANCASDSACACTSATETPTPTPEAQTSPLPVPVTGVDWPTAAGVGVGAAAIIFSILLAL